LKIGKKFRGSLDFVEDGPIRGLTQKCAGVISSEGPRIRVFQGKIWEIGGEKTG
jgi:hypothetical protein